MTYLVFLIIFICAPLLLTLCAIRLLKPVGRFEYFPITLMGIIALVYTTPWDNYLIMRGVWTYPSGVVSGVLGYVPIEEYFFMVLQTIFAGVLWTSLVPYIKYDKLKLSYSGLIMAFLIGLFGTLCLCYTSGTYLGLILIWACPPLALQWGLGLQVLIKSFKNWAPLWIGFSAYLCIADSYAISEDIWSITLATRTGIAVGNLPLEEILFFFLTNLFVLQGLCLWRAWRGNLS